MTSIVSSDFHFVVPESFLKNLVQIGTVVSEKIRFEFLYVHNLGPRSTLTFRSQAAIVSEKSTVFTFSYRKA